jgi:hypothetical protein
MQEAKRLLLNRQLSVGGWNYGNTMVFGQNLHPMMESTGVALNALAGIASREEITPSLAYPIRFLLAFAGHGCFG